MGPTDEAKKPASERRAGEEEEAVLAKAPTKPNPPPQDAIVQATIERITYHDT